MTAVGQAERLVTWPVTVTLYETLFPVRGHDCDSIHRQVQTRFPDETRAEAGLLYRREGPFVRIRSPRPPVGATCNEVSVVLELGRSYAFNLRANVTKKQQRDGRKNSVRVPDKDWDGWLLRHQYGFVTRDVFKRIAPKATGRKKDTGLLMTHTGVDFSGILQCTDVLTLGNVLLKGLGPGKCYGFGMLVLESLGCDR